MAKIKLSKEEILHLAHLARLSLSENLIAKLGNQLSETLDYVKNMAELDTSEVEPTSQTSGLSNVSFEDGSPCDRRFSLVQALANAPKSKDGYFIVDRILDKNDGQ